MQNKSSLLLPVLLIVTLSSCRTYRHIYSPAPANSPAFRDKGESQLTIAYSGGDGNNGGGGDLQKNEGADILAAYAVTNHFAVTGSYYFRKERDLYRQSNYSSVFASSAVNYKRNLTDFSVGYFTPLSKRKKITFNIYTGFGSGNFSINDQGRDDTLAIYSRFFEARIHKWYMQPGFHFWFSQNFSLGLTARYCFISFSRINTSYNDREQEYFFLDRIERGRPHTFEPTLSIQFGIRSVSWLKIYASTTVATGWLENYPSSRAVNGSAGLVVGLFKKVSPYQEEPK